MGYEVYCDASYRRTIGSVIGIHTESDDKAQEFVLSNVIKGKGDPIKAEALAVLTALRELQQREIKCEDIRIYTDNLALVDLINLCTNASTDNIYLEICNLLKQFKNISLQWIPREKNKVSHNLCKELLGEKSMERLARKLKVLRGDGDIFYVQSTNVDGMFYKVSLDSLTCNCRHFQRKKKCKHIVAAQIAGGLQ